jgi:hypothetical protein
MYVSLYYYVCVLSVLHHVLSHSCIQLEPEESQELLDPGERQDREDHRDWGQHVGRRQQVIRGGDQQRQDHWNRTEKVILMKWVVGRWSGRGGVTGDETGFGTSSRRCRWGPCQKQKGVRQRVDRSASKKKNQGRSKTQKKKGNIRPPTKQPLLRLRFQWLNKTNGLAVACIVSSNCCLLLLLYRRHVVVNSATDDTDTMNSIVVSCLTYSTSSVTWVEQKMNEEICLQVQKICCHCSMHT